MSQALQNLTFMVSLLDKVSGPAGMMMKTMDTVTTRIQAGYRKIGYGAAGLAGTGYALDSLLQPTKEMQAALGEMKSLDAAGDTLTNLTNTALKFSIQYGASAADFVHSAYSIKSAIDDLAGSDLAKFTESAAILAKGSKANVDDITKYFGTMYGVFHKTADEIGKARWIDELTGQTAMAVKIFKTDGIGMAEAFGQLGANAGITPLAEQMAVLGKLQGTMSGSEAATKYKSFIFNVGKAQKDLGLKFTDSANHMLPMVDILTKIKGKYGDLDKVANSDLLKKAFGTDEAVGLIKLLSTDIAGLNKNIAEIGNQKNMDLAKKMAADMTMPWDRAAQGVNALKTIIGMQLLPEINLFFDKINGGIETMMRWSNLFPELTRFISLGVLGIFGLIAGISALSIIVGGAVISWFALKIAFIALFNPMSIMLFALYKLLDAWAEWQYGMNIFDTMAAGYHAAVRDTTAFIEKIAAAIDYIMTALNSLKDWFKHFNLWEFLLSGVDALIGKMNMIPGVNIDLGGTPKPIPAPTSMAGSSGGASGGLMQKFSSMNQNNQRSIGTVQINNYESKKSLSQLVDEIQMAGG